MADVHLSPDDSKLVILALQAEIDALRKDREWSHAEIDRLRALVEKLTVRREPRDYFDSEAADNA